MTTLPIHALRPEFAAALLAPANRLILAAPTGSGKSTQVPQFLLDSPAVAGRILVLQPRRLAARLLAERVAFERGGEAGGEVGYQTRFENRVGEGTRLRFITEGILPRLLLRDPELRDVGAVVFDEFHERSLATDLSLALVRGLQQGARPDLRLVVMSATLDLAGLRDYLPGAALLQSAGRTFPIELRYQPRLPRQEAWDAAAAALAQLLAAGATGDVLIFMPGVHEIRRTVAACQERGGPGLLVLPLYGDLPPEQQRQVMAPAPAGVRKVIVATNIAETSLTIPGIRHVIDAGLARIQRFDAVRGFNTLFIEPISRAAADQRAGRAGREAAGICIRLWSQLEQNHRHSREEPEIRRIDLAEAVLQTRLLGFADPAAFPWPEPPPAAAVSAAVALLGDLGALAGPGLAVTTAGQQMAAFPTHPRLARFLLAAATAGCLREACLAAALLGERLPTATAAGPHESDLLNLLQQFSGRHESPLSRQIQRAEAHFLQICRRLRLPLNLRPAPPERLAKAFLLAYPDHLARRRAPGSSLCELRTGRRGELDRGSAVHSAPLLVAGEIRETGGRGQGARTLLALASAVEEEWLHELFPDRWRQETSLAWNEQLQQVEKIRRTLCLEVALEEKTLPGHGEPGAAELLARMIRERGLHLPEWNAAVEAWISRVRWVASQFPEKGLITYDEADTAVLLQELCAGEWRYAKVREKPVLPLAKGLLGWEDQRFVEQMAPETLAMPNGRKMRLEYRPGQPPHGRARIQELFDLAATPRVAGGRVPVLLEILAPNQRPVQITDDLAGFWQRHYPALKKTLARRYPKHEWRDLPGS
ncbi:MAG: ATP-dependent helicase HrpB [Lentisphaeria bacterium]|jgi:ATP-dependent helicase HrpB